MAEANASMSDKCPPKALKRKPLDKLGIKIPHYK
jgi:hypothetical protein